MIGHYTTGAKRASDSGPVFNRHVFRGLGADMTEEEVDTDDESQEMLEKVTKTTPTSPPNAPPSGPVSYTHLTLPTNREV